ncbi:hypothetical protein EDC94DRAFT_45553 [Helicostylum pulchrum]|nr:hypothetical protein EDC94DRAFT_45553 [Helicostylum pulchrum]
MFMSWIISLMTCAVLFCYKSFICLAIATIWSRRTKVTLVLIIPRPFQIVCMLVSIFPVFDKLKGIINLSARAQGSPPAPGAVRVPQRHGINAHSNHCKRDKKT